MRVRKIWLAFLLGFFSHFVLDFIPHWDYLKSIANVNNLGIVKISIDIMVGLILLYLVIPKKWFFSKELLIMAAAIFGALLPDLIQFIYYNFNAGFLHPLVIFHNTIHYFHGLSFWQGMPSTFIVSLISFIYLWNKKEDKNTKGIT